MQRTTIFQLFFFLYSCETWVITVTEERKLYIRICLNQCAGENIFN